MTNRMIAYIVKDQSPLIMGEHETIQKSCQQMHTRRCGSALVVDAKQRLAGIFTGRDAVRALAEGKSATGTFLRDVMTPNPLTITPEHRAIDALRTMSDGGFRHLPVLENNQIWGVVSRGDFKGMEIDRLEDEEHLWEIIR